MDICIDFDGTCVTHEFPEVGKDIGAVPVLKKLVDRGHRLILFTMRSDHDTECNSASPEYPNIKGGRYLSDAESWFEENNIPLYGKNINPSQILWTKSPKAYGQLYIDDAALGCPLKFTHISDKPYVDWVKVEKLLREAGVL